LLPPDDVHLVRLVWDSADYDGGKVLPSAFRRDELHPKFDPSANAHKYVSVDRGDDVRKDSVDEVISQQIDGDLAERLQRFNPFFAYLVCQCVREAQDVAGDMPFEVRPEQILPINPGHCGIHNVSGKTIELTDKKARGYIDELRTLLIERIVRTISYDELFGAEN
jgi:hypothetical protein